MIWGKQITIWGETLDLYFITNTRLNSKQVRDLSVKNDIKVLEDNMSKLLIGVCSYSLEIRKAFLRQLKSKSNKRDIYLITKTFYMAKPKPSGQIYKQSQRKRVHICKL